MKRLLAALALSSAALAHPAFAQDTMDQFILNDVTWVATWRDGTHAFTARDVSFKEHTNGRTYPIGQLRIALHGSHLDTECLVMGTQAVASGGHIVISIDENRYRYDPNQRVESIDVPYEAVEGCGVGR
jgi:hypothetical protein